MARRRKGIMSEQFKQELAKDLGIYDTVQREGWGAIRARDAGNLVKRAVQIAEQKLASQYQSAQRFRTAPQQPVQQTQQAAPSYQAPQPYPGNLPYQAVQAYQANQTYQASRSSQPYQ
jgi:small acid-soluble spore protein F (minor alpha/beta-type SASP)